MNVKKMKIVDETIGPIVCFIFHWYNQVKKILFRPRYGIDHQKVRRILLIKFFGMGSIILATPMIRALKEAFPNAEVLLFTFRDNEELARRIGIIDEVIALDTRGGLSEVMINMFRRILYIRRKRCDISIDLEFFAKSSTIIQYLCATKIRIGYYLVQIGFFLKTMWRGNLLTHNVYYNPYKHTIEVFLALANSIGVYTDNFMLEKPVIYEKDRTELHDLLSGLGERDVKDYIVMNINAGPLSLERRWPLANFITLAQRISRRSDSKIILIGNKNDVAYANEFAKGYGNNINLINLAGKLTIGMLIALFEGAKLFISNDSGPLHLAASLGIPVVAFFGPETPSRFGPVGTEHTVFYSGIYCSPCLNLNNQKTAPCNGNNECMRKINIEDVFRAIEGRYLN